MSHHSCETCKHWQCTRDSKWADCNWVIGELEPKLLTERNEFGYEFNVPFDPHHVCYFDPRGSFMELYKKATRIKDERIRVETVKRLKFIQTRKDYICGKYDEHHTSDESLRGT